VLPQFISRPSVRYLAGRDTTCGLKNTADMQREIGDAIGDGMDDNDTKGQNFDPLLELKVAVKRDEDIANTMRAT